MDDDNSNNYGALRWRSRGKMGFRPSWLKLATFTSAFVALASLCSAIGLNLALGADPGKLLLLFLWGASLSAACWFLPPLWAERSQYSIYDRGIETRVGAQSTFIARRDIVYARIDRHEYESRSTIEFVYRDRRRGEHRTERWLGVVAAQGVLDLALGMTSVRPSPRASAPASLRLAEGEKILFNSRPLSQEARWPRGHRAWLVALLAAMVMTISLAIFFKLPSHWKIFSESSLGFLPSFCLLSAEAISAALAMFIGLWGMYHCTWAAADKRRTLRYLITSHRVLIVRKNQELHVERTQILNILRNQRLGAGSEILLLTGENHRPVRDDYDLGWSEKLEPVFSNLLDEEMAAALLLGYHHDEPLSISR